MGLGAGIARSVVAGRPPAGDARTLGETLVDGQVEIGGGRLRQPDAPRGAPGAAQLIPENARARMRFGIDVGSITRSRRSVVIS
jgi:hypothetical protein